MPASAPCPRRTSTRTRAAWSRCTSRPGMRHASPSTACPSPTCTRAPMTPPVPTIATRCATTRAPACPRTRCRVPETARRRARMRLALASKARSARPARPTACRAAATRTRATLVRATATSTTAATCSLAPCRTSRPPIALPSAWATFTTTTATRGARWWSRRTAARCALTMTMPASTVEAAAVAARARASTTKRQRRPWLRDTAWRTPAARTWRIGAPWA
mmetsp:Transcript_9872/g.22925  ORF Transcript_9872/g.22925 Transcript_9872/m.22925 type:complete len:221 (+) Transcript_9872:385-1047(+)